MTAYSITPNWGELDVDFLDRLVEDTGMSNEAIVKEVSNDVTTVESFLDIQSHIYVCMSIIVNRFITTVIDKTDIDRDRLPEPNIHSNYLCSMYDSVYNDYDLTDLDDEVDRFIEEQLGKEQLDG